MELLIKTRDCTSLNERRLAEIHKSFLFAQKELQNATNTKTTIYRLQIELAKKVLEKTTQDFHFYHLKWIEKDKIKEELEEHERFLKQLCSTNNTA